MTGIKINGPVPIASVTTTTKVPAEAQKPADTIKPQMTEISNVCYGKDLISTPTVLKANEPYLGKSYDVQGLGNSPIKVEAVTPENVEELSKSIDI